MELRITIMNIRCLKEKLFIKIRMDILTKFLTDIKQCLHIFMSTRKKLLLSSLRQSAQLISLYVKYLMLNFLKCTIISLVWQVLFKIFHNVKKIFWKHNITLLITILFPQFISNQKETTVDIILLQFRIIMKKLLKIFKCNTKNEDQSWYSSTAFMMWASFMNHNFTAHTWRIQWFLVRNMIRKKEGLE